ncbi:hypothetical protein L227DRAFT_515313 [Lentinus tigrinus ALCF2SS1-6]|uniref:Uncharacterized protein n=1 Tax=Lentinus tigrinus ALCF2SS1-6 TaxID=1328759 RepID=A0A5C2RM10_9APHY|nr:hypothetical protein L227DRAFT_515313 [Lentinus tigrinus ALCF2SS1-6]
MVVELCLGETESKSKHKGKKHGRRSTKTTDRALCLFVNAHALSGLPRCRRYHFNLYFSNEKALLYDHLAPDPEYCCSRCAPTAAVVCCDLCDPTDVTAMIPTRNDSPAKTQRNPTQLKIDPYTPSEAEHALRRELHQWRDATTPLVYGDFDFFGPDMLLRFKIIDRIVDLAHARKLDTVQDLEKQTKWCFSARYGADILRIVHVHFPKNLPPSPFVSTPLSSRTLANIDHPTSASSSRRQAAHSPLAGRVRRAPPTCGVCGEKGHRSKHILSYSRCNCDTLY